MQKQHLRIQEEKEIALKQRSEEEERIREENRRIKEWEDKFDIDQKKKEEELIKKFYSDHSIIDNENTNNNDQDKNNTDSDLEDKNKNT